MKIAIHQMCSTIHPAVNGDAMTDAISRAAEAGAAMYFAPEMSMLVDRDRERAKNTLDGYSMTGAIESLRQTADDSAIWVHIGSIPVSSDIDRERLMNRSIIVDEKGGVRAHYDKMHMFDVSLSSGEAWRESSAYDGGNSPTIVETPLGAMGLTICYDIRFPDLFSALSQAGVDIIAVPAAFTVPTGKAHWHTLLRARAIEAQAFVVAAAQSGLHEDGRHTFGHSLVVDPWGEVLLDMGDGEGLGIVDIDLARIAEVRAQIPVHANRRSIDMMVSRF